jgi:dihydropteroate synthase
MSSPDCPPALQWRTTRFELNLSRPQVMGVVNLTPDSFSDGGLHADTSRALAHATQLIKDGADLLDVGGESTRPGAQAVPWAEEWARIGPFLREAVRWQLPISVDTSKPEVMQAALDAGVDIINDIWALRQPGAQRVIASHPNCGVCLMHMHRDPQTMQLHTLPGDVRQAVNTFLGERIRTLVQGGVDPRRLAIDPGIGFGKTVDQNFQLLAHQTDLLQWGRPVVAGWSRKSALGAVLAQQGDVPGPLDRQTASVSAALLAVEKGASVVRVHDVSQTVQALKVWQAMHQAVKLS